MALSLITGGSGAGKTEYIYKKVIDWSMKEPQRQFFVIVPEQSTMQGQKDIVRLHPRRGTMNIDIVSFERLAYRILGNFPCPSRRSWTIRERPWSYGSWRESRRTSFFYFLPI